MSACAKCGKKFGLLSMKYNSETVYYMGFYKNLTLNERYPDNPYRGMNLCEKCYREVYENAPALLVENSFDDKSIDNEENASNNSGTHSGMILASTILSDSSLLTDFKDKYVVIYDQAIAGLKFDNLNWAINIMAERGWRCLSITSFNLAGQVFHGAIYMYALMEKLS